MTHVRGAAWCGISAAGCDAVGVIERDVHGDITHTFCYPELADDAREMILSKCGLVGPTPQPGDIFFQVCECFAKIIDKEAANIPYPLAPISTHLSGIMSHVLRQNPWVSAAVELIIYHSRSLQKIFIRKSIWNL